MEASPHHVSAVLSRKRHWASR